MTAAIVAVIAGLGKLMVAFFLELLGLRVMAEWLRNRRRK